jgi:hypothetical protein
MQLSPRDPMTIIGMCRKPAAPPRGLVRGRRRPWAMRKMMEGGTRRRQLPVARGCSCPPSGRRESGMASRDPRRAEVAEAPLGLAVAPSRAGVVARRHPRSESALRRRGEHEPRHHGVGAHHSSRIRSYVSRWDSLEAEWQLPRRGGNTPHADAGHREALQRWDGVRRRGGTAARSRSIISRRLLSK